MIILGCLVNRNNLAKANSAESSGIFSILPVKINLGQGGSCGSYPFWLQYSPLQEEKIFYKKALKYVLFKKILEKPFSTQNLQKLPQLINAKWRGSFCKFCVLNGFSRIFLNKTDFNRPPPSTVHVVYECPLYLFSSIIVPL